MEFKYMHSLNELIGLAAFAGFSFWTCSFISDALVAAFREGKDNLPTAFKMIGMYLSGGLASISIFAGAMWLLVEVIDVPVSLVNDISYMPIALLAIFCGTTTGISKILFPNLFLQGASKKE